MKTTILPQIKDIEVKDTPLSLNRFHLDETVLSAFPNATAVFEDQSLTGEYPITFSISPLEEEEYRLIARSDKIIIAALGAKGLMYALFTLSELDRINDGQLQEFDAFDKPSLPLRAFSDDISRGQISTIGDFCSIIRRLARYKYNTYMPYMEDVFRFESIPGWGQFSDPVPKEEWKAIIFYAAGWNISVRPVVNLLGHFNKLCRLEEFQPLALHYPDGRPSPVMDPKKPAVRELISKMLQELVDCFGPGVVHGGGDEPAALTEIYGKQEAAQLFIAHYSFVAQELKKLNCSLMLYADFFAPTWGEYSVPVGRIRELPADTDFIYWDYLTKDEYPLIDALHRQNINLVISPGTCSWNRFACDIFASYQNTRGLLKADAGRSRGMVMSAWADGGDTLREYAWPGTILGANFSWSPDSDYSFETYYELYHKSFFGFDSEQAQLLDPLYHPYHILKCCTVDVLRDEMWRDPFQPVSFPEYENIGILQAAMKKAAVDLSSLTPSRNKTAFDALRLTVARTAFVADKVASLSKSELKTVEQAIPFADKALLLSGQLLAVKELHKRLWFATNRFSEWQKCECRYDNLYDRLRMFARTARLPLYFENK